MVSRGTAQGGHQGVAGAPPAPPAPSGGGGQGSESRRGDAVKAALIGAIATVAAAAIAGGVAVKTGAIEITNEVTGSDLDGLEARVASLEDDLATLQDDVAPQPPANRSDGSGTTTTEAATPEIWHETAGSPYPLPYSQTFDLDSPADDGDWGLGAGGSDVSLQIGSIERRLGDSGTSARMAIVDAPPSYETCASEERLVFKEGLATAEVVSGRMLCYQTSEGRWAYVHLVQLDDEARIGYFEIVVWKLPTDP